MPATKKPMSVEWMCTHCGQKIARGASTGRPMPGICPRRTNKQPHRWVKNRTF